jgi:transcriptional regulator with XRE-family HTH domain
MPGANDLIHIPDSLWQRPETVAALRSRDIARFFALLRQYAGASQTQIAIACGLTQGKVSDIMRGVQQVESLARFERIADGLAMPDPARVSLGLAPRSPARPPGPARPIPSRDTRASFDQPAASGLSSLSQGDRQQEEDPVRRRTFVGLTGATIVGAMLDGAQHATTPAIDAEPFAPVLAGNPADLTLAPAPLDIAALTAATVNARRQYQACRYSELTRHLPDLLTRLHTACHSLDGQDQLRAWALSADAHHVAAGLLLKLDDQGLASLAADRSMRAAIASQDPLTVGASARIITHTLMNGRHLAAAIATASSHAARLDRDIAAHTPDSLSVYGSLLLRGAIAAAQHDDRDTALQLLGEADDAARRLGVDGNLRWTAFGPVNAQMHRVSVAVTLGDAGTAVDVARRIDLSAIPVTERKAALLIDTSRAFLQWGRHEKAYTALRAAEQTAPEEVTGRPSVHRLIRDLAATAPPSIRRDARQFAAQAGVTL